MSNSEIFEEAEWWLQIGYEDRVVSLEGKRRTVDNTIRIIDAGSKDYKANQLQFKKTEVVNVLEARLIHSDGHHVKGELDQMNIL